MPSSSSGYCSEGSVIKSTFSINEDTQCHLLRVSILFQFLDNLEESSLYGSAFLLDVPVLMHSVPGENRYLGAQSVKWILAALDQGSAEPTLSSFVILILAMLLVIGGVELNPGLVEPVKCGVCRNNLRTGLLCSTCSTWFHFSCQNHKRDQHIEKNWRCKEYMKGIVVTTDPEIESLKKEVVELKGKLQQTEEQLREMEAENRRLRMEQHGEVSEEKQILVIGDSMVRHVGQENKDLEVLCNRGYEIAVLEDGGYGEEQRLGMTAANSMYYYNSEGSDGDGDNGRVRGGNGGHSGNNRDQKFEFWNLVNSHNPDIVIGTESWLSSEVTDSEVFRNDYVTYRCDRLGTGRRVFICVKECLQSAENFKGSEFEMVGVVIVDDYSRNILHIIGLYRAPKEGLNVLCKIRDMLENRHIHGQYLIVAGDLNLPQVNWQGTIEGEMGQAQSLVNALIWKHNLIQVTDRATRGDSLLDIFLLGPSEIVSDIEVIPVTQASWEVLSPICRDEISVLHEGFASQNEQTTQEQLRVCEQSTEGIAQQKVLPCHFVVTLLFMEAQNDLNRINDSAKANKMKINSLKSKAISFTRKRNKIIASYTLGGETILEVNKCKYLGITFSSDLGWGEHVTDTAGKAWRMLHFVTRVLRKVSDKSKEIAYKSLFRPVMEYGAACWEPYRLKHIKTLEKIKNGSQVVS
ncbi:hypothetical protein ANN_04020 [Periplaneta americana]|uniref:Endonuclease/exonuclease/phosphatase domain-containing protein n=1 Tax=Periplaneta americana TaxID=6978 RepID=A0ABQ8T7E8_PERAM|nr:hypothetical protein ANN_04020 [Periplaneta americana]